MTSHAARLYALVAAVFVFFVAWAAIAAHPWPAQKAAAADPRLASLQLREQRLRAESLAVRRVLDRRWAAYRRQLALRRQATRRLASAAVAAPPVRVVTLPPLTVTRTS
jgi:hypothetical protein